MEKKQVEVTCPCCESRLLVDTRSEKVLRSRRPEELDQTGKPKVVEGDWDDALSRVKQRESRRESVLDDALEREGGRADQLDDLFREASKRADEDEDDA
jgi:DNA-directed RNA polymerase subunit RPC12/RpoP